MKNIRNFTSADHNHNLVVNSVHEMVWGFGMAFHSSYAVIPLFLKLLGAPNIVIGSVAGVFTIGIAIPQIFSAFWGGQIKNLRRAIISVHGLLLPPIVTVGFIFAFIAPTGHNAWIIYYTGYIIFALALGIVFPIWADFLESVHIREKRGAFFGVSFAFSSVGGFFGGLVVKRLLSSSIVFPVNFGIGFLVYSFCMVLAISTFLLYRLKLKSPPKDVITFSQFLTGVRGILRKDHNFRKYIFSRILLAANYPAISLYVVHIHEKLQFDISETGVFTAITVLLAGFSSYFTGKIGDRFGHKHGMVIVFIAYLGALVIALNATTITQAYLIFVFLGLGQGGFWTSAMSLVYEFAGENDNKIYFALIDSLTAPFVLLFIILSGLFVPIYGIPAVFIGIGIIMVMGILSLGFLTKDPKNVPAEFYPPKAMM